MLRNSCKCTSKITLKPVSYTHLDVYKRQPIGHRCVGNPRKRWLEEFLRRNRPMPCCEDDDDNDEY